MIAAQKRRMSHNENYYYHSFIVDQYTLRVSLSNAFKSNSVEDP